MQTFQTFFITLNNATNDGYIPGSTVEGQVLLHNEQEQTIKSIAVDLDGVVDVSFKDKYLNCTDSEDVFYWRVELLPLNGAKLQVGWHRYPFECRLPLEIPSSFAGLYGKVEYEFKATMKTSVNINRTAVLPLIVSAHLDLNTEQGAGVPIAAQMQKHFSCSRCTVTGPIEILFQVPKTGFAMGEDVQMSLDVDNQSSSRVRKTRIYLTQEASFHAMERTKIRGERRLLTMAPSISSGEHRKFVADVKIPKVSPTNALSGLLRRTITLQHFLEVRLQYSMRGNDFARRIPIIIGNIPLPYNGNGAPTNQNAVEVDSLSSSSFSSSPIPIHLNFPIADATPTVPTFQTIIEPENSSYPTSPTHPYYPSSLSMEQGLDNISTSSRTTNPPAYENFTELPPSYEDAIKLQLREKLRSVQKSITSIPAKTQVFLSPY